MPKHYAVGENIVGGNVTFKGTKSIYVPFAKPFKHKPKVKVTLYNQNNATPYIVDRDANGFTVQFTQNQNDVEIGWEATE